METINWLGRKSHYSCRIIFFINLQERRMASSIRFILSFISSSFQFEFMRNHSKKEEQRKIEKNYIK